MMLAEALIARADSQKRIAFYVKMQEGEKPLIGSVGLNGR